MMVKLNAEYYNLEKTAEVLSTTPAEVNRLREQSKLRGFRDGSNWKFLKEDIHSYLAETIKARSGNDHKPGESDFDLAETSASSSSFDILMEDAPLPDDNQLVSATPVRTDASDLDLASLDNEDDLALAEETRFSAVSIPTPQKAKPVADSGFDLVADDDSDALTLAPAQEVHAVTLDNESILDAGGGAPQLGLAGESGFDILVADDNEDILQVKVDTGPDASAHTEFELEPPLKMPDNDDSESSSQVIAIDHAAFSPEGQDADPFGQGGFDAPDFTGFDSGIIQPSSTAKNDPFGSSIQTDAFTAPSASTAAKKTAVQEEEYSTGTLAALVAAAVVMLLPGLMLLDTVVHIWSWNDPFVLNSFLMETISGWFGLT